jgi:CRP-like cAMP-binding protein
MLVEGLVGAVLPGAEQPFKEFDAPTVLGEVAFLDHGPRSVTLVALTDCELLRLSMPAFEVLAAHDPDLGRAILLDLGRILARRLRHATDLLGQGT